MIKMDLKHTGKTVVESEEELISKEIPNASQPKSTHFVTSVEKLEDVEKEMKRFSNTKLVDPKSNLVSLKHAITMKKYHEKGVGIVVTDSNVFQ